MGFTQDHRARERAFAYLLNRALLWYLYPLSFLQLHPVSVLLPTTFGRRLGRIARLNKIRGMAYGNDI